MLNKLGMVPDNPEVTLQDTSAAGAVFIPGDRLQTAAVKFRVVAKEWLRELESAGEIAFGISAIVAQAVPFSTFMQVGPVVGESMYQVAKVMRHTTNFPTTC